MWITVVDRYLYSSLQCVVYKDDVMDFHPKNLRLDGSGISKVLGALEAEVMDVIWSREKVSVREVMEALEDRKEYSFNTIMTIMNRLVEKGLLRKCRAGNAYAYEARVCRDSFCREVTRSVVSSIVSDGSFFQVAAFAEALRECSEEDLESLRSILNTDG